MIRVSIPSKYSDIRWTTLRDAVKERDGYKCVKCGDNSGFNVHHMRYIRGGEIWDSPMEDLVTLCRFHHGVAHGANTIPSYTPEVKASRKYVLPPHPPYVDTMRDHRIRIDNPDGTIKFLWIPTVTDLSNKYRDKVFAILGTKDGIQNFRFCTQEENDAYTEQHRPPQISVTAADLVNKYRPEKDAPVQDNRWEPIHSIEDAILRSETNAPKNMIRSTWPALLYASIVILITVAYAHHYTNAPKNMIRSTWPDLLYASIVILITVAYAHHSFKNKPRDGGQVANRTGQDDF